MSIIRTAIADLPSLIGIVLFIGMIATWSAIACGA
jgi:hypothetical protein